MTADKKLIVFDKDGTLIDFDAFWVSLSALSVKDVLRKLERSDIEIDEFLKAFGVENGVTDIDGILCKGTYEEMGEAMHGVLKKHGCSITPEAVTKMMLEAYGKNSPSGEVKPTCENIREVLLKLKEGRRLIVVTTDNPEITKLCLEKLCVLDLFDEIFADDGKTPAKPNPACLNEYCEKNGIAKENVLMVGDTMTDVKFAKNAGVDVIAVGKTERMRKKILPFADRVVPDISYVLKEIE